MDIRLLGTAAADGIPGLFSDDEVSRYARENGGKDIRTRSGALVDGVIKIDLPPDTMGQLQRDRLNARDWSALVFTHSDDDHLAINEIQYALIPFTDLDHLPYTIYANAVVSQHIRARYPDWPLDLVETHSFETFRHGPYQITPIKATHIQEEDCHNLIVEREGKTLLYATDTGIWPEPTFEFLAGVKLDLLVIECTDGFCPSDYPGHLAIKDCIMVVNRLRAQGTLAPDAPVYTTHHSIRGKARHCDLERALLPHGIEPGYDGLKIDI
ncbi:MBL fold metallo-hydrolase [Fimbriimonas ginsengisoli]|uniref:Metal-dependent hydrolase of the beta-lactamase superfamily I n=1 Tax=Fimbriimonas ginsengisoli Gsoil 348 TaxID=661478 RepID=A0A068NPT9_FIMGI|nr:MBL fold metallo-hydrolase [Fimbriimonas ginsengisoli]AIE85456.1 Metal-dependent hydrolase of the beta-lactamase superfamily I [Fimbriimonas ginsengisoli Gsoil 348]